MIFITTRNFRHLIVCIDMNECAYVVALASIALHGHISVLELRRNASIFRATPIHAIQAAPGNQCRLAACVGIVCGKSLSI